jgi:hypothetical protein
LKNLFTRQPALHTIKPGTLPGNDKNGLDKWRMMAILYLVETAGNTIRRQLVTKNNAPPEQRGHFFVLEISP